LGLLLRFGAKAKGIGAPNHLLVGYIENLVLVLQGKRALSQEESWEWFFII